LGGHIFASETRSDVGGGFSSSLHHMELRLQPRKYDDSNIWNFTDLTTPISAIIPVPKQVFWSESYFIFDPGTDKEVFEGIFPTFVSIGLVSAVPEPTSWVMMIAGLGITAAMLRRRRVPGLTV
jgi:hypothetical protein